MVKDEFMTVTEAAKKIGVSPRTIQRYCRQGRLNYKWIQGIRHKELRILPPIPIANLPGARKKHLTDTFDYVTKTQMDEYLTELRRKLEDKDLRITILETELSRMKTLVEKTGTTRGPSSARSPEKSGISITGDPRLQNALETFLREYNTIRPKERRLIIKMARELEILKNRLKILGIDASPSD